MIANPSRTPFFPGFHKKLFGRRVKSALKLIEEQLDELGNFALGRLKDLFGSCLPSDVLSIDKEAQGKGVNSREAILTPAVTFWGFLSQVLSPGSSCREALTKIQVLCASQKQKAPLSDSSVYCKARHRLKVDDLQRIQEHSAQRLEANTPRASFWKGRRTLLVDATTASMPDTPENQERWPQSKTQAEGCGFPTMTLLGIFSLASCALIGFAKATLNANESGLLYTLKELFRAGDVLLGDRIYCSYDIKTSMQMDVLRCKTPEMIEKEVLMHMVAYNMVRLVMQAAALNHGQVPEAMSFKGTIDRIKQWAWPIIIAQSANQRAQMYRTLLESIAEDPVVSRPNRYEPRVVKRRAKAYESMTKPRQVYRDEFEAARLASVPS